MKSRNTLEGILDNGNARQAWVKLKSEIPQPDLKSVSHHLLAIANRELFFPWNPPSPRQAKRLAERLAHPDKLTRTGRLTTSVAKQIEQMNLYFGSQLPLGDPQIRNLPKTLLRYAQSLAIAARTRRVSRRPNDFSEREVEILRILDRSKPGERRHFYEAAAELIQAAYNAAKLKKIVDADQLRKIYNRRSLAYRLQSETKSRLRPNLPDA